MNVLVLCTGNSCRSQIAEGFLRLYAEGAFEVYSAGIEKHGLNPKAVETMAEIGIDISHHTSNTVDELAVSEFDYVITVCDNARENCPYFPAKTELIHQTFTDPSQMEDEADETEIVYTICRDAIGLFCKEIAEKISSSETAN